MNNNTNRTDAPTVPTAHRHGSPRTFLPAAEQHSSPQHLEVSTARAAQQHGSPQHVIVIVIVTSISTQAVHQRGPPAAPAACLPIMPGPPTRPHGPPAARSSDVFYDRRGKLGKYRECHDLRTIAILPLLCDLRSAISGPRYSGSPRPAIVGGSLCCPIVRW